MNNIENDIYFGEQEAKYIKKKAKKKVKKSDHKHIYDQYVLAINGDKRFYNNFLIIYCGICGKVDNLLFDIPLDTINRMRKQGKVYDISGYDGYISDIKYIPIAKENNDN